MKTHVLTGPFWTASLASLVLGVFSNSVQASESFSTAVSSGKTTLGFRLRHESVQDDAFDKDASASTLRTRLTWRSGEWNDLSSLIEFDHVGHLVDDRFNDTRNGRGRFPTVADPKGADLNQASLQYQLGDTSFTAGRQRINMDNQRFVGGVGWRQNEQTYDALRLTSSIMEDTPLQFDYAWIANTRRIFGPQDNAPAASLSSNHHLFNVRWTVTDGATLGAYSYWLDFDDAQAWSSQTTGGFITGSLKLEPVTLLYHLEAARQSDHADNPTSYDADYHRLSVGAKVQNIRVALTEEHMGADEDAGVSMQTPLATLHAFYGWADKFLANPAVGSRDRFVQINASIHDCEITAAVHRYDSDVGDDHLGSEWNLQVSHKFSKRYKLTAKYADYQAEDFGTDARKAWLIAEASF